MLSDKIFYPISNLSRVGPNLEKFLSRLVQGNRIFDLLLHYPLRVEKISFQPRLFEVKNDELIAVKIKIESHLKPSNPRQPFKVIGYTPTGYVSLVFFKIFPSQLEKLKISTEVLVFGYLKKNGDENQIVHPNEILSISEAEKIAPYNVIYPLGVAITQKFLQQKIQESLKLLAKDSSQNNSNNNAKEAAEWIDSALKKSYNWPDFFTAIQTIHNPKTEQDILVDSANRKRLAYDELFAWQLALLLAKQRNKNYKNLQPNSKNLLQDFLQKTPFELTKAQISAITEITNDINSKKRMLRLLQGDVGSGKTIVALCACLEVLSKNKQACIISPTTVLAKQHFKYFSRLLEEKNIKIKLLTSATTKKQKSEIIGDLKNGKIDILISTHAVLEDDVIFSNLGLAIIDEQHRFGVMQRLKLVEKGQDVDCLLMSATPIPRSLMMTFFGDMDVSTLSEKPKNRQPIETLVMSNKKFEEVCLSLKKRISMGEKVYWICPLIEDSIDEEEQNNREILLEKSPENSEEKSLAKQNLLNLAKVKERFEDLKNFFQNSSKINAESDENSCVGFLHGKLKEAQKEQIMADFSDQNGQTKILVSTTVVEVGVDVSDATVIVIENAENFGLAQLHQLRGRVGRSEKKSYCILLYGEKLGANGRKRLEILRQSNDGFFIAEEDLKMRGSGELLGTKQSGFPEFRIANLNFDTDLLKIAHKNAALVLHKDSDFKEANSLKYKYLMRLFGYDECLKMVESG